MTNTYNTLEEMVEFMMVEVKKTSKRSAINSSYNFDASDLESYIMVRAYEYILKYDASKNPNFEAYIRGLINQFKMNFLKSPNNVHSDVDTFSALSSQDDEGSETDFESTFVTGEVSLDTTVVEAELLNGFLATLNRNQRLIVELRAGIISSLTVEQLSTFESIVSKQGSSKKAGNVYLSNSDIANIVGIHRNHVTKNLNAIAEKALDFGLEELV